MIIKSIYNPEAEYKSGSEVAKELQIKMSEANELVGFAVARLRHPQNVAIVSALASKALASIIEGGVPVR